jgi:hypothetical protein
MKRLLGITLMLVAISGVGLAAEAKAAGHSQIDQTTVSTNAQWRDRYGRWNNRRARTFTRSRIVRYGRRIYRETYRIRYFANGRYDTRLISRVRIA